MIEVEYTRLISIAEIGVGEPLPVADAQFVLRGSDANLQTLDVVGRRFYHFFELIEGLRAASNEAGARQEQPVYVEPPVLRRLSVASPAEIVIEIANQVQGLLPYGLAAALLKATGALPAKRKEWYEGTGQKKKNELADLEKQMKQLELEQKAQEVALQIEVLRRLRQEFPDSSITDEKARQVVEDYVIPPLRSLGIIGIVNLADGGDDEAVPPGGNDDERPSAATA